MGIKMQQRILFLFLCSSIVWLFTACSTSRKSAGTNVPAPVATTPSADTVAVVKDTVVAPVLQVKTIRITLLLPLQLTKHFENDSTPDTDPLIIQDALPALHFYEGAQLAKDTLSSLHCNIVYSVVDAGYDSLSTVTRLNIYNAGDADAVISLLPPMYFKALSVASQRWKKPVYLFNGTNPQALENYPYLCLVTPSNLTQIRQTAAYIAAGNTSSNIVAVYREQRKENDIASLFGGVIDSLQGKPGACIQFNWKGGWSALKAKLSKSKPNVLIIPTSDESFLSSLLNKLKEEESGMTIRLVGMPAWETFESIDPMLLKKYETVLFNGGSYFDIKSPEVAVFRKDFIHTYHADPLLQAYMAYDVVRYIAAEVNMAEMHVKPMKYTPLLPGNRNLKLTPVCEGCGQENKSVNFLKYGEYEFVLVK